MMVLAVNERDLDVPDAAQPLRDIESGKTAANDEDSRHATAPFDRPTVTQCAAET